jgi:addiction module HigA family antidote
LQDFILYRQERTESGKMGQGSGMGRDRRSRNSSGRRLRPSHALFSLLTQRVNFAIVGNYEETVMARDPIHPGRFLADELETLGMSVPEVAAVLHVPANRIYQLLKGQRVLTADTALRLSQWLGTSAEMWLNLQKLYELRLAEQKAGKKIKSTIIWREPAQAA